MALTLFDATVKRMLIGLHAAKGYLEKGRAFAEEKGVDPDTFLDIALCEDMAPLRFQVHCLRHHTATAVDGVAEGTFGPPPQIDIKTYADAQAFIDATIADLESKSADALNASVGKEVIFAIPSMNLRMPFTAEDFLLSFSMPNFNFHTVTAYDILRVQGVPIGKMDFMGPMPIKMG
ncbi:MAG: DUF1993 domain-containing protein [Pseudomonadota bacterium]